MKIYKQKNLRHVEFRVEEANVLNLGSKTAVSSLLGFSSRQTFAKF